jgi:NAD(P)-dependent dehydrogenase (short-subunit alcohol dehydrogenase family)
MNAIARLKAIRRLCAAVILAGACVVANAADTVLITGANSGIGLEFAKQYAELGWTVYATHRRNTAPPTLAELASKHPNVRVEQMDVTSPEQIKALADRLKGTPIDVLINNAGVVILGGQDGAWRGPGADTDGQKFGSLDYEQFDVFMRTNVAGPARVTEAFFEHVKASRQKKVIAISSSNGMITGPPLGGGIYWYRLSKAALNKVMISISADVKKDGVTVVMFNPGATRVEKQEGIEFPGMKPTPIVVKNMIGTIGKISIKDTGRFLQQDGKTQPW